MKSIFFVSVFFSYLSFTWAGIFFFNKKGRRSAGAIAIILLGTSSMFATLWAIISHPISYIGGAFGIFLTILALIVFWLSIQVSREYKLNFAYTEITTKDRRLLTSGPYSFIRHPFYFSYTLVWIACLLAVPHIVTLLPCLIMIPLYFGAAKSEETELMKTQMSSEYSDYRSRVGMFFPKFLKIIKRNIAPR